MKTCMKAGMEITPRQKAKPLRRRVSTQQRKRARLRQPRLIDWALAAVVFILKGMRPPEFGRLTFFGRHAGFWRW